MSAVEVPLLEFVQQSSKRLRGENPKEVRREIERAYPDIIRSLNSLIAAGDAERALTMCLALENFWMISGRLNEAIELLSKALALTGASDATRCYALESLGYLLFWAGDDKQAIDYQNQAISLARTIGDHNVIALALACLARSALRENIGEAKRFCDQALVETDGRPCRGRSSALHVLGVACQMSGEFEQARRLMSERVSTAIDEGDLASLSSESGNLSMVERQLGNVEEAERLIRQALQAASSRGDELMAAWLLNQVAAILALKESYEEAAIVLGTADAGVKAMGSEWPPDELEHFNATSITLNKKLGKEKAEALRKKGNEFIVNEVVTSFLDTNRVTP